MTTPICIPITVTDTAPAVAQMQRAAQAGAGMIELRCDQATAETIAACLAAKPALPAIVTIRPTWEGGAYTGDEAQRIALFTAAIQRGADLIDIEWVAWRDRPQFRALAPLCRARGCKLILSNHDFTGRPADLPERLAAMQAIAEADILKIVWTATGVTDAVDALRLTRTHAARDPRPLLALTMGPLGQLSRLLGAKFGQPFTFATLPDDPGSAAGQPSIADLLGLYRWNQQRLDSRVYGVVGWPVGHSMSPAIHNAGFTQAGFNAVYVPLPIEPTYESFCTAIDALRACPDMHWGGLSVTIPHKENALRYVRQRGGSVDELSARIGVLNTIVMKPDGSLQGLNTDYAGALDALVAAMHIDREGLRDRTVAIIGAGGAARAIVAGLAAYGAAVVIYYNRELDLDRARVLAADFDGKTGKVIATPIEELSACRCQIIINATPLGMSPHVETCPIDFDPPWNDQTVVFDVVYNPLQTRLLKLAAAKGACPVSGLEMFVRQAATQFEHFTGLPAPIEAFRSVMQQRLA